ncbi:helix-turn-helix domain-containing protein [Micromonospora sonchi]|uniref:helix-turn-helix domain-containing protein n=1 Tax=Micromonospora sonchi TaxID=1763543 RepID=UPI0016644BE8|nr:helix-turn-helix domain-containing protein [Micromonospora sonchi]
MRNELPVGRRVAQWRVRRNMTQQQFADRLGKSKSWVDKVERGVRRLERVSNLREIADALRIDVQVLLAERPAHPAPADAGVERIRAALARYHVEGAPRPPDLAQLRASLEHAKQSYRHARYPVLLALLPGLLDAVRVARPNRATDALLVPVYGLIALTLVKVDQGELAWLAADRGMAVALATEDPQVSAVATVPLCQALRCCGRNGAALRAAVVAAHRLVLSGSGAVVGLDGAAPRGAGARSLRGTLLLQAALAAADRTDHDSARKLVDQAAEVAEVGSYGGGGFGPAAVRAVRVLVEAARGDLPTATVRHERLLAGESWRWLPPEHRAGYLLDVARVYASTGEMFRAGRTLLEAEGTARSEVHDRPAARDLVAALMAGSTTAPAALTRLAATLGAT